MNLIGAFGCMLLAGGVAAADGQAPQQPSTFTSDCDGPTGWDSMGSGLRMLARVAAHPSH